MLDLIRLAVELLGWLVVLWGTGLILWATSCELRRRVARHMVEHAQGVCDGAAAAGMVPWAVPGNMPFAGMSGTLSYCPWPAKVSSLSSLDGPAVIVSGVAGQDRMMGFAHVVWCEGPPPSCDLSGKSRQYARLFWTPLIPIGYKAGFWIGRKFGERALAAQKPDERAKWVPLNRQVGGDS